MKRIAYWLLWLAALLLLAGISLTLTGCGSSSTQIRFVHSGANAGNVDVLVDTKTVSTNLAYANSTSYMKISSGSRQIEVRPTGTTTDLINSDVTLAGGTFSTGVIDNASGSGYVLNVYTDDHTAPPSGKAALRFIHAAQNAQNIDIYVTTPGQGITGLSPTIGNVAYPSATAPQNLSPGSYEIVITQQGTQNIIIDTGEASPLTLTAGQIRTFVAIENLGNVPYLILSDVN